MSHIQAQALANAQLVTVKDLQESVSVLQGTGSEPVLCQAVLQGCRNALQQLIQQHGHSLAGLPDQTIQQMAAAASMVEACGAQVQVVVAGIRRRSGMLGSAVRAHVLELDEAAAMQV